MVFNIYELFNFIICLLVILFITLKYELSNRVFILLFAHLLLVLFIDLVFDYSYWPDQIRYFLAAVNYRENYVTSELTTVSSAALFFSLFPLFIGSIKSLAFINFLLYVILFVFCINKFNTDKMSRVFKVCYFFYPSLILFSSLGLRDVLIIFCMFFALYYLVLETKYLRFFMFLIPILFIKVQNCFLLMLALVFYVIAGLSTDWLRKAMFILYFAIIGIVFIVNIDVLLHLRAAFFVEDTGLSPYLMPSWSLLDIYRVILAPFFFDARNIMQIFQSLENLLVLIFAIYIYRISIVSSVIPKKVKNTLNYFIVTGMLLYSFVIFNYGTINRYKFPMVCCWILIMILLIDRNWKYLGGSKD